MVSLSLPLGCRKTFFGKPILQMFDFFTLESIVRGSLLVTSMTVMLYTAENKLDVCFKTVFEPCRLILHLTNKGLGRV